MTLRPSRNFFNNPRPLSGDHNFYSLYTIMEYLSILCAEFLELGNEIYMVVSCFSDVNVGTTQASGCPGHSLYMDKF